MHLQIHVLPAGHGDCSIIEYGEQHNSHLVVVDGGLASTSRHLQKFLRNRPNSILDLLVVSHIDSDHIAGALALLRSKAIAARFKDIWFNGSQAPLPASNLEKLGFKQGDDLTKCLRQLPHNEAFGRADVVLHNDAPTRVKLAGGANIVLLSPSQDAIQSLRTAWSKWINETKSQSSGQESEDRDRAGHLEVMGSQPALDTVALAATAFVEDGSISNRSSIAFIFEYGGQRILMAADAHASELMSAGEAVSGGEPHPVDVFKVSHHGSGKNTSHDLLRAFPSTKYVLSTDGKQHGHPEDVALARIVSAAPNCELIFNYRHPSYARWQAHAATPGQTFTVSAPSQVEKAIAIRLLPSAEHCI